MQLAVADLFVVGLGFDLVGAWLLARGLIAKPEIIVKRSTTYWGSDHPSGAAAAEDRIDGMFGVGTLLLGFLLQAVGYLIDLADGTTDAHSIGRALTALLLLVVAASLAVIAWRVARKPMLWALFREMARWQITRADEPATRQHRMSPTSLAGWGTAAGSPRHEGEDDWAYAKRVFGLTNADLIERPTTP